MVKLVVTVALFCLMLVIDAAYSEDSLNLRNRRDACGVPSTMTDAQKQEVVKAHNDLRAQEPASNMMTLSWNEDLAARAQELVNTCNYEHGMQTDCSDNYIGQNLYLADGGSQGFPALDMTAASAFWYSERKDFDFGSKTCTTGENDCGHWSQVVWANTREVGCGTAQCPQMTGSAYTNALYIACNYRVGGNVANQPIFLDGPSCSNCDSAGTGAGYQCVNKLCVSCTPSTDSTCKCGTPLECQNGGVWADTTCSCSCAKGFYGDKCESKCGCQDADPNLCEQNTEKCSEESYKSFMKKTCAGTCSKLGAIPCIEPANCKA